MGDMPHCYCNRNRLAPCATILFVHMVFDFYDSYTGTTEVKVVLAYSYLCNRLVH